MLEEHPPLGFVWTSHSLRKGAATAAYAIGAVLQKIKHFGGWAEWSNVCKEAWMFIHKVGFLRLRKTRAEVDGLVNPCLSRNTPPVYHIASGIATRAWLKDHFDPKHGRTERIPHSSSDQKEWHLPA
eukprot:jgi/Tetstr1/435929/TSEL_024811.t1